MRPAWKQSGAKPRSAPVQVPKPHRTGRACNRELPRILLNTKFAELFFYALRRIASGIVPPMTSYDFLTTAYVVMLLAGVALLAVVSAVTLVPFDRSRGHRGM